MEARTKRKTTDSGDAAISLAGAPSELRRALVRCGTQSGVCRALHLLQTCGLLNTCDTERKRRSVLQDARTDHAHAVTPYGTVVQTIDLGFPELRRWEYCAPAAYMWYIASLNGRFGEVMAAHTPDQNATVVVYLDEICPGNPFRPEKSRKVQAVYFCILQWPQWLISRTAMWPVLGLLRSKFLEDIPGGIGGFFCTCLQLLFGDRRGSLKLGVILQWNERSVSLSMDYGGTLADEKALKEIHDYKGAQGTTICMDCRGLVNSVDDDVIPEGACGLHRTSLVGIPRNTNESIWSMADALAGMGSTDRKRYEQIWGIKHNPRGVLFQESMRRIHRPIDHYKRDWMHTLVSGGIANRHTGLIVRHMESRGADIEVVKAYALQFELPHKYGKVSASWLDSARVKEESMSSFASVMLCIVPIIAAFLIDIMGPTRTMPERILCYCLLADILGLLTMGADDAASHLELLSELIQKHHDLFVRLYNKRGCKPKFHHALHLPEVFRMWKKVIGCFQGERKHKATKRDLLYVFRHCEHTSLMALINDQCEQISSNHSLFQKRFLAHATIVNFFGLELRRSSQAVLDCGLIAKGDIVYVAGGVVAVAMEFYEHAETSAMFLHCEPCKQIGRNTYTFSHVSEWVDAGTIVDAMAYRKLQDGSVRVLFPFAARFH